MAAGDFIDILKHTYIPTGIKKEFIKDVKKKGRVLHLSDSHLQT